LRLYNKNILVTGGAGFIGSHLIDKLLERNNHVRVIDNLKFGNKISLQSITKVEFYKGDITNKNLMSKIMKDINIIFHLAANVGVDVVSREPLETMITDAIGVRNIVDIGNKEGVEKIIFASSSMVYDKDIDTPIDEETRVSPTNCYSVGKLFVETYLMENFKQKGCPVTILRLFNVYGPRQDERMVIPRFFKAAINNAPLKVYGDGKQIRDFTYVEDVTEAFIAAAECQRTDGKIYNISKGTEISIYQLAKLIIKVTGSRSKIEFEEIPLERKNFEVKRRVSTSSKFEKDTGFTCKTELVEGLKKCYIYYKMRWKR